MPSLKKQDIPTDRAIQSFTSSIEEVPVTFSKELLDRGEVLNYTYDEELYERTADNKPVDQVLYRSDLQPITNEEIIAMFAAVTGITIDEGFLKKFAIPVVEPNITKMTDEDLAEIIALIKSKT